MTTTEPSIEETARVTVVLDDSGLFATDVGSLIDTTHVLSANAVGPDGLPEAPDAPDAPEVSPTQLRIFAAIAVLAVLVLMFSSGRQTPGSSVDPPVDGAGDQTQRLSEEGSAPLAPGVADSLGGEEAGTGVDQSATAGVELDSDPIEPWPAPPVDHDPHLLGRPMVIIRPTADGSSSALLYVNHSGRPTLVDLSGGFLTELVVADGRLVDNFMIENGRVVTSDPARSNLDGASERAMSITVARSDVPAEADSQDEPVQYGRFGPNLCLDLDGCAGLRWTDGDFGDAYDLIRSLDGDPFDALDQYFGESELTVNGPWINVEPISRNGESIRIPTPLETTVVWAITQSP